jgi:hypothetical protein
MSWFFTTGGTLHHNSPSYVERSSDQALLKLLSEGEFCYVLTARQMGKSSSMVRTAMRLKEQSMEALILDLTAIGQNLNAEQWYDGLLAKIGQAMQLEEELEDYWMDHLRLSPVQRWFQAISEVVLPRVEKRLILFFDELDVVRGLSFCTDEFFAALRQCYHARIENPTMEKLTFCLLGVATPADLITDPRHTPFNVGHRIELHDFTPEEARPLSRGLERHPEDQSRALEIMNRVYDWTHGHPYLTQRLCRAIVESRDEGSAKALVDKVCEQLFLSNRASEQDDNLLYVRERLRRCPLDQISLLDYYNRIWKGEKVPDDEHDPLISELLLTGLVRVEDQALVVRNRIYQHVFDHEWIERIRPVAEVEMPDGTRMRIRSSCSIGRTQASDICLPNPRVSRRHAMIQKESNDQLWLIDSDSRNGTLINGRRVTTPMRLNHLDVIQIGPFTLTYHQPGAVSQDKAGPTQLHRTVLDMED